MGKFCCFFGHGREWDLPKNIDDLIICDTEKLIQKNVTNFYVGGMGAFDNHTANAINKLKNKYPYIKLYLVLPYFLSSLNKKREILNDLYEEIILPDLGNVHYKAAIQKRNKWMVNNSDFMIAYVKNDFGGARQTYNYALKQKIEIINLFDIS